MIQQERETVERIREAAERKIWVTFRKEGIHRYPAAAVREDLNTTDEYDVNFLSYPHRHIFHFRVWLSVTHNDRDVEFIQFKRWLENLYKDNILDLNFQSCEMMSDDLYSEISQKYPGREVWIEVSEDGENGSFIKY